MIVLDASAAIDWLLHTPAGQLVDKRIFSKNESLHCPHLIDLEVVQVLRRLVRESVISAHRAQQAIQDLGDLRATRYPHFIFLSEIWRHRHNLSAYDSAYLVLAEQLGATLITRDARFAASAGRAVPVEVF